MTSGNFLASMCTQKDSCNRNIGENVYFESNVSEKNSAATWKLWETYKMYFNIYTLFSIRKKSCISVSTDFKLQLQKNILLLLSLKIHHHILQLALRHHFRKILWVVRVRKKMDNIKSQDEAKNLWSMHVCKWYKLAPGCVIFFHCFDCSISLCSLNGNDFHWESR